MHCEICKCNKTACLWGGPAASAAGAAGGPPRQRVVQIHGRTPYFEVSKFKFWHVKIQILTCQNPNFDMSKSKFWHVKIQKSTSFFVTSQSSHLSDRPVFGESQLVILLSKITILMTFQALRLNTPFFVTSKSRFTVLEPPFSWRPHAVRRPFSWRPSKFWRVEIQILTLQNEVSKFRFWHLVRHREGGLTDHSLAGWPARGPGGGCFRTAPKHEFQLHLHISYSYFADMLLWFI